MLTLANNERISLTKEMRLLFEVGGLQSATPATVSRGKFYLIRNINLRRMILIFLKRISFVAGILYVNNTVLGWYP